MAYVAEPMYESGIPVLTAKAFIVLLVPLPETTTGVEALKSADAVVGSVPSVV